MSPDPENLLGDWERRVREQTELTTELSRRMQEAEASETSPDGEVHLTVDHTGSLSGLQLTDRAMHLPADDLAHLILNSSRRAQARMAQQMAEVARTLYGSGSPTTALIADAYRSQFPAAAGEEGERR
ncbi:YbaB/EbfC family nucleoid-associated protein [Actinoplanes sp. NPDC024001]|uniref:YbaB/EbfC family nucleoid-associated protein n=1 Tax=Actinoplanes sp. NPDC024001 TaxID=3154598 RepID=UPI0033ED30C8